MQNILITGHLGLIGRHLKPTLEDIGFNVIGLDLADNSGNICQPNDLASVIDKCHGIIHLAAVSRVVWGQQNPNLCWSTNAIASENILKLAMQSKYKPWVLVASSREVYGEPTKLPVSESSEIKPVNVYGLSKAYMEEKALDFRRLGLNTAIVRLSNVYGCWQDHADRVLPAFCSNAVLDKDLRVDGAENTFDFTHIHDVVDGLRILVEMLTNHEKNIPTIHLLPGIATSLNEAAKMAIYAANSASKIIFAAPRNYDVSRFTGNPSRALEVLGWRAKITPHAGIKMLVKAYQDINTLGI